MPLKREEISWILTSDVVKLELLTTYNQQQIQINWRLLLAEWICNNAEMWFYLPNGILDEEAAGIVLNAAQFLEQKMSTSDDDVYKDKRAISEHVSYLKSLCCGTAGTSALYLIRMRHCLLEESNYFFRQFLKQDDIDNAVSTYVSCSVRLGETLDKFAEVLKQTYAIHGTNVHHAGLLWTERQKIEEILVNTMNGYEQAMKCAGSALISYKACYTRQMARESIAEKVNLHADQLQAAYDTAARMATGDLARLQESMLFASHFGENLTGLRSWTDNIIDFLYQLVSNCLILEKQVPQIVRKGAKFSASPVLRMLCPSVFYPELSGLPDAVPSGSKFVMKGGLTITPRLHSLTLDNMVRDRAGARIHEQQPPQKMLSAGVRSVRSLSNRNTAESIDVSVYFLSESQAQDFVKKLELPPANSGALIHTGQQLSVDKDTKSCSAAFKSISLSNFSRGDRKHSQLVTEEKFCLAFTCGIQMKGLMQIQDTQQVTTVLASVLSLPTVVTVHNSQEASASIATLWDNYFAEMNRLPFEVPRKALWADVKHLLNGRWKAVCGQGLSEQNLAYLANRLLFIDKNVRHTSSLAGPLNSSAHYDNETVTWTMIAKDLLPPGSFTFWDWFHSCLKLMANEYLYSFWPDHLVGFASHEQVEEMLKDRLPGTFLLRFASTELGAVVIPYVKKRNNMVVVERGFGPCYFKECEPAKVISDLGLLKYFYPSMRDKQDVLLDIENANVRSERKRRNPSKKGKVGYSLLAHKVVPDFTTSDDEDGAASYANSNESMNCDDIMSTTPPSVSPFVPVTASGTAASNDSLTQKQHVGFTMLNSEGPTTSPSGNYIFSPGLQQAPIDVSQVANSAFSGIAVFPSAQGGNGHIF